MWPHRKEKFSIFSKILNFSNNFLLGFEELCIGVLRKVVRLVASGSSTMVKTPNSSTQGWGFESSCCCCWHREWLVIPHDTQYNNIQHTDIQPNDIQHNYIQHNDIQHNDIQHNDIHHNNIHHNDTQHNDTQHIGYRVLLCWLSFNKPFILSVIMLSVVMMHVVALLVDLQQWHIGTIMSL